MLTTIELRSVKMMLQTLEASKFDKETETVTRTACSRANCGFRPTRGTGRFWGVVCAVVESGDAVVDEGIAAEVESGDAVDEGIAVDVIGAGGLYSIPNCVRCVVDTVTCVCEAAITRHPSCFQLNEAASQ